VSLRDRSLTREELSDYAFVGLQYQLLLLLLAFTVIPLVLVISTSFKSPQEFFGAEPHIIPLEPTLEAWRTSYDFFSESLWNSAIVATGTAILSLIITIPGAYVFARMEFPGRKIGFYAILLALLFPYVLLVIPISDLWFELGIYNTIPGLIIAYQVFVTPFAIWILRDFFENLPADLEEAAQVYGCSQFQSIYKVILPLSMPAIVATGFLAFLTGWNDFLFSAMLTTGTGPRPAVPELYLQTVGGEVNYWGNFAAYLLTVGIPPLVLYMVSRQYLTESFALGD